MMNKFTTIWLRRDLVERMRELKKCVVPKPPNKRKEASWSDVVEYLLHIYEEYKKCKKETV